MSKEVEIAKLKSIHIPWWARALGSINARLAARAAWRAEHRRRQAPQLITTVTVWVHEWGSPNAGTFPAWYHLYENAYGKRTYDFAQGVYRYDHQRGQLYNRLVVPWLNHKVSNKFVCEYASASHTRDNHE